MEKASQMPCAYTQAKGEVLCSCRDQLQLSSGLKFEINDSACKVPGINHLDVNFLSTTFYKKLIIIIS